MSLRIRRTLSFTAIILGFFMALLDATIVNVALPEMTRHFGGDVGELSWVINGYNLAFAVFILTAARIADQFGRKKIFLIGVLLFTGASLLAGFAPNVQTLIALRVIQGLAGAIIVPVTVPMATELFPKDMHGIIIGIWGGISGLAAASGPALGGILTEKLSWKWIFFVNVPLGLLCLLLTLFLIKESYDPTSDKRIDVYGTLLVTGAMFGLTYGLIKAEDFGWRSATLWSLLIGGVLLGSAFLLVQWKGKAPMIPLSLLKIRPFSASAATLLIVGAGLMNIAFLTSFYLTRILGMTELRAGLVLSVLALGSMVTSVAAGPMSNKYGARWFAVSGVLILIAASYALGQLGTDSATGGIILRLVFAGMGIGLTMAPLMSSTIRHVPEEKIGISSGVVNMTKALGSVLGVAIIVTVLQSRMEVHIDRSIKEAVQSVQANFVLTAKTKTQLIAWLEQSEDKGTFASTGGGKTSEISKQIDQQTHSILAKVPEAQRARIKQNLTQQKEEIERITLRLSNRSRIEASAAFGDTFRFSCWILLLGIPLAYFSDRGRKRPVSVPSPAIRASK